MDVGDRLAYLRKMLTINQSDLAMLLGCTQQNISFFEKNGSTIPLKNLTAIRDAYKVNLDWMISGEGEVFLKNKDFKEPDTRSKEIETLKTENTELKQQISELCTKVQLLEKENIELSSELVKLLRKLTKCQEALLKIKN